jgi:large subunit ribosomal protein L4
MIRLALRRPVRPGVRRQVVVVDSWGIDAPKTKDAVAALHAIGAEGRVLVVVTREQEAVAKSFRNLTDIHVIEFGELNAYDVLCNDWIVFSQESLPAGLGTAEARPVMGSTDTRAAAATPAEPEPEPAEAEPDESAGDEGVDDA